MNLPEAREAAHDIVVVCRKLYDRGLIASTDGNVSVRLGDGSIIATPSGVPKGDLAVEDCVRLDPDGRVLEGKRLPSSEIRMHLRIYARRSDARAVVHAHPPTATGFAVAGESFMAPILPEVILQMGEVPLVRYATPGTDALPDSMEPFLASHDAFLLANHGATTIGASLAVAHQRMESLEHAAKILLAARMLGRVNELSADDVRALKRAGNPPHEDER